MRIPDAVARALDQIHTTFASKNADYADDRSWRSNFEDVARQMGFEAQDAAEVLIAVKQARLRALRTKGTLPRNESVLDTILDRAVYSVIALALYLEDQQDA